MSNPKYDRYSEYYTMIDAFNDSNQYQKLIDDTGTYIYIGEAVAGTAKSAAGWRIKRVTSATGDTLFADNATTFTKVWNDRASYTYSIGV
jgi:hypothetical protein